jgi:hypothetical protein
MIEGWYTYDPPGQGISFAGAQAVLFGFDYVGNDVWVNLVDNGVSWTALRRRADGSFVNVGSVRISVNGDGSLQIEDAMSNALLGGTGFSPLPPPKFSGKVTKIA